ncbi:unnamed protein product [Gulo gulo]|uniref:Uncharacterized protein n=1 Tax=Gulo gulo TaxID=48420 RepID=A0A9X9MCS7_GULGU|nr:unnamed protein product [Gulo gulo]
MTAEDSVPSEELEDHRRGGACCGRVDRRGGAGVGGG